MKDGLAQLTPEKSSNQDQINMFLSSYSSCLKDATQILFYFTYELQPLKTDPHTKKEENTEEKIPKLKNTDDFPHISTDSHFCTSSPVTSLWLMAYHPEDYN